MGWKDQDMSARTWEDDDDVVYGGAGDNLMVE
jgi:hypothetical protein